MVPIPPALTADSSSVLALQDQLLASLRLRVQDITEPPRLSSPDHRGVRVAILFSGGLDCTVLARLCANLELVPAGQGIDLLNVAFENPRVAKGLSRQPGSEVQDIYEACPDRTTGRKSYAELQRVCPDRDWRFVAVGLSPCIRQRGALKPS